MQLSFSHRKATEALNFFAIKAGGRINKMKALKLVFFADRYHFRQYGRPVTNDEYIAMEYGPVPSGCKDLAEMSGFPGRTREGLCRKKCLSLRSVRISVIVKSARGRVFANGY